MRTRDPGVETPIHCAAEKNHVSCVDALVKAGAVVDSKVPGDWSALHMAVEAHNLGVVVHPLLFTLARLGGKLHRRITRALYGQTLAMRGLKLME